MMTRKHRSFRKRITIFAAAILIFSSILLLIWASFIMVSFFDNPKNIVNPKTKADVLEVYIDKEDSKSSSKQNVILYDLQALKIELTLMLLFVIGVSTLIIYKMTSHMIKPLNQLNQNINIINSNNLNCRIDCEGADEIALLTQSFNSMLERLEVTFQNQKLFINNVSHELRTPISNLKSNLQVFKNETLDEANYRILMDILFRNTERLETLIKDLTNVANDSLLDLDGNVNWKEIIAEIQSDLSKEIASKEIDFIVNGEDFKIHCNKSSFYRAILNIIENSIKYNKLEGKVMVKSYCEEDKMIILIRDTGTGIPSDSIERVFEPFYRVENSRLRGKGGSGLGLSISKNILERHGFKIEIESVVDIGTSIRIIIDKRAIS